MRRILATLAVVGVLFLSAETAKADYADGLATAMRGDYAAALKEFRPLAEQGDAEAQYNLGVTYMHDTGVPVNYAEAVKWYSKAAEQGHAAAQSNLGLMYALGIGVPEDYVKAHMWFLISEANGDGTAAKDLANVKKRMTPAQIAKAERLASKWLHGATARKQNTSQTLKDTLASQHLKYVAEEDALDEKVIAVATEQDADGATLVDLDLEFLQILEA